MQTNIEQVTDMIRSLPVEEFDKVREVLDEVEKEKRSDSEEKRPQLQEEIEQYKKARKWIDEHSDEYMNKWVCLEGDKLIAIDDDGRTVYQKAKEAGIEAPFIHHIVDESMPFGGW